MKCRKCGLELCEGYEFCYECGTYVNETIVILCSGRRKDGSLCGAELQEKFKYCTKCGTRVDQSLFQKKQTQCSGLKRDGSSCGNLLNDADEFCLKCGTQRGTASSASGNTVLFGSGAKNDGGNFDGMKTEQSSALGFKISSAAIVQGNSMVFGMTSQLDGEVWRAFHAIETGYSAQMHQLGFNEIKRFGRLLSSLYEREWETAMKKKDMDEDRIILQYILTWTPFSHYLKMFYGDEKKVYLISPDCIQELTQAVSVIDQRMQALKDGTITLRDLRLIKDAEDKFQELTMIMVEKSEEKKGNTFNVAKAVKIRQREVDCYLSQKKYVAILLQLCQHVPSFQTSELDRTIKHLKEKKDLCIRDICQPANVEKTTLETFQPKITAYKLSDEVVDMLEPMDASYGSNIFLNLWQSIGRTSKAMTLDDVCKQVWKPTISKMKEITQKLVNGEILFGEMEKYLGQIYGDNYDKMVEEMILINVSDIKARERVKQLKQYRQLEACVEGAKTILNVAKAYELNGDFEVIKTIASQQNTANKMMKEFDDSLLKICAFLEDLTTEKTNCLDHFINCKCLVLWLRESMKGGLKELKVFVDLTSISAVEGDMEIAKVNCLHAATTGYASLIFDLEENSGYKTLFKKCQILWKELKADPKLPMKLLDTNRHLEWLKTVKRAHGSVEVTSLSQAEAINSKGIFCVGALETAKNTTVGPVREVSDRYIVCGPHYVNIREAVTKVVLGEGTDQLDKAIKDTRMPENKKEILLCLALHREITMSKLQEVDKNKVTPEVITVLHKYCSNTRFMKNKEVAQKILQNTYGIQSPILTVTPGLDLRQQGVLCLLMHCDIVLRNANGDRTLVEPLIRLATRPQTMRDAFIPTMPQDDVQEIKEVLLVNRGEDNPVFYRCPNGHPYVIGDCGRPYTVSKCPKCGLEIGGQRHVAHPGNAPDPGVDRTETGHILGRAENRTQIGPERTLTPAYCGIIRLLTHLTMMLGANIDSLAVSQLIKPDITDDMVSQFLWQHIEHDLNDLHRALGKSLDDVFIIMHSILSGVMECPRENKIGKEICGLVSKDTRNEWEKKFSEKFVAPALQKMEVLLKECNQQLAKDKRLGSDPLLCLLYEITQPQEKIPLEMLQENPAMWRFRSQITMDHLRHEFEVRMTGTKKAQRQHMVLQLFLKEEHHLRAIRYLPSILKLQRILFQKYQRKLDRAEASAITVERLRKESDGDELPKLLEEYAEVWDLVRENLVFVPKEYRRHHIDDSTPVSQLLPTASDAGQCAYSVLEFLFRKQNDFLDNYYQKAKRRITEITSVKVRDITPAHLISYHPEQDILPLVLANCNYSFEVGKGTTIEYNFANLEKQIIDRFLFGKCFIDIEIELMVYRAEYTNATVFRKLQEKIPQESLSSGIKHKISEEFHSLPNLCQALDNLDIAISFLKSIGGNPDNNLDKFMVETLRMEQSLYSPKAKQICQYQHAKSLWLLLSLEKTKHLALYNQMIFDGLPEHFHEDFSAELTEQVMTFLQSLSLERLELLLELMFECIILVISLPQNPDGEDYVDAKEKKFKDYMIALMTEKDQEFHVVGLDTFPDDVLSKFCVATWTLTYQCLQQKKRQRY